MSKRKPEKRIVFTTDARLSVRRFAKKFDSGEAGEVATLSGYAITWGTLSSDRGGYKVRLQPGSASFTPTVHALFHHSYLNVIGNTGNGTLRLYPDDTGVRVEIDLPDTTSGRDVEELVEARYVTGMSFAMVAAPEATAVVENGETILDVTFFLCDEVTVTPIPAFESTSINVAEDDEPEETAGDDEETDRTQLSSKKNDEEMQERASESLKWEEYRHRFYDL